MPPAPGVMPITSMGRGSSGPPGPAADETVRTFHMGATLMG